MADVQPYSLFTDFDIHLFKAGKHFKLYEKFGSHLAEKGGQKGTYFAVWAPSAKSVSVAGTFNDWHRDRHFLQVRWDGSGIWEGFIPQVEKGTLYKYIITTQDGYQLEKGDPFAVFWEVPPKTASIVWDLDFEWQDDQWMQSRSAQKDEPKPVSIYELHYGSWKKTEKNLSFSYRQMADELIPYIQDLGFTHVEFLPIMQHPFFDSWGYQITGYFAPDCRFGIPTDFMYLIDRLHQAGIGVLLDWVPSHFPGDDHGLYQFDGSHLYEHADPRQGYHPDWTSYIFNYGRNEVRSFLISNAMYWLDKFHVEGLRVDAVASMLYLDYSRKPDEWIPNEYGGNENLAAISLLQELNDALHHEFPDSLTIAEESTAWPGVTLDTQHGGLGFDRKWMMGWMHDSLRYMARDSIYRQHHQGELTFSINYAFSEKFVLPLSHDEVVHGKGSLIQGMPGDEWTQFANLRLLYGYMYTHPGDKLLFMGGEIGQVNEWSTEHGVEWQLLDYPKHRGLRQWVKEINHFYRNHGAFWADNFSESGFRWIATDDWTNSVFVYIRRSARQVGVVVCNFSPNSIENYVVGVPDIGSEWVEVLNSDADRFGGSGIINSKVELMDSAAHSYEKSIRFKLAPLAIMIFVPA